MHGCAHGITNSILHSCMYLASKFFPESKGGPAKLLKDHSVCLCDDDNDLEMAIACGHAYIPEISSSSMKEIIDRHPDHFTQTGGDGTELSGTAAAEAALLLVLERIVVDKDSTKLEEATVEIEE